jgi:hypothetical protein
VNTTLGPISVAIHIKNTSPTYVHTLLDDLHALYISTPLMAAHVDVHLVLDAFDRQFNTWRNAARLFARTDFVMLLDVDFAVCTDFRSAVRASPAVLNRLREGHAAVVVPAFEFVEHADGLDLDAFPTDKKVRCASDPLFG